MCLDAGARHHCLHRLLVWFCLCKMGGDTCQRRTCHRGTGKVCHFSGLQGGLLRHASLPTEAVSSALSVGAIGLYGIVQCSRTEIRTPQSGLSDILTCSPCSASRVLTAGSWHSATGGAGAVLADCNCADVHDLWVGDGATSYHGENVHHGDLQ